MKWLEEYKRFIGEDGRVFRYSRNGKEIIECKMSKCSTGYYQIRVMLNGKSTSVYVHRLVAMAFLPNPDNKEYVDHINHNGFDNRVENLRWATPKENNMNRVNNLEGTREWLKTHSRLDDPINYQRLYRDSKRAS